uniref:PLAT domain-containing protein n=1 Tax=Opuntia streptacantha TaxID=393608 RepID=A0A7C9CV77_OPUST
MLTSVLVVCVLKYAETGSEKPTVKAYAHRGLIENGRLTYEAKFEVPPKFGEIGAVMVENEHHQEMHLADIVLDFPLGSVRFTCNSWVHSKADNPDKRVFFSNKV